MAIETPTPNSSPSAQLLDSWTSRQAPESGGSVNFDTAKWLSGFYDYYFSSKPAHINSQIVGIARNVLGLVTEGDSKLIANLQKDLDPTDYYEAQDFLDKAQKGIKLPLKRVRQQYRFDKLLGSLENPRVEETPTWELEAKRGDEASNAEFGRLVLEAEKLPEEVREHIEDIQTVNIDKGFLKLTVIDAQIEKGDTQAAELSNQYIQAREHTARVLNTGDTAEIGLVLSTNRELLTKSEHSVELTHTLNNLHLVSRMSPVEWRRKRNGLTAEVTRLLSEDTQQEVVFQDLIKRGEIDPEAEDYLDDMALVTTCLARVINLEGESTLTLTSDQKKQVYAASLKDLVDQGLSPVIAEGVIQGTLKGEDLAEYAVTDWLSKVDDSLTPEVSGLDLASKLAKINEILLKGASLAAAPLGVLLMLQEMVQKLPIPKLPLPFSLPLPGGEGGASLELGNPFEGVLNLGSTVVWRISDFPSTDDPPLFRLRSSSTYNPETSQWEEDTHTSNLGVNLFQEVNSVLDSGMMEGKKIKPSGDFWYIPTPYGQKPYILMIGHTGTEIDMRNDGSIGIDTTQKYYSDPAYPGYERASVSLVNSSEKKVQLHYRTTPDPAPLNNYPFDEAKTLIPLISSLDVLPDALRRFMETVQGLTAQELQADQIKILIQGLFTYSLDPANKAVYDEARKKGPDEFMQTLFSFRKVKCDGAATAAIALLRAVGIPARMAVGYRADEDAEVIRSKNAHAWVECLVNGEMKVIDPTPFQKDEKTEGILRRSDWMSNLAEKLSMKRWTKSEYEKVSSGNDQMIRRMFQRINPDFIGVIDFTPYPYFDNRKMRQQARKDMLKDQAYLKQLERHLFRTAVLQTTSDQLLDNLDKAPSPWISESRIRQEMVGVNLKRMMPAIISYLSERHDNFGYPSDVSLTGQGSSSYLHWELERLDVPIREAHGDQFTTEYLDELARLLRGEIFQGVLNNEIRREGLKRKDSDLWDNSVKHLLTAEMIEETPFPALCESYLISMDRLGFPKE